MGLRALTYVEISSDCGLAFIEIPKICVDPIEEMNEVDW